MPAVHGHVVKWPDIVVYRDGDAAHDNNGRKESDGCQEQALTPALTELVFVDIAQASTRYDRHQDDQYGGDEKRGNPETAMKPGHRNTL